MTRKIETVETDPSTIFRQEPLSSQSNTTKKRKETSKTTSFPQLTSEGENSKTIETKKTAQAKTTSSTEVLYPDAIPKAHLAECWRCPLYETGKFVPSSFPTAERTNGLVFCGESPGAQEKRRGRPFAGPSGQLLDKVLEHHGIKRDESLLTNAALCNYADEDKASLPGAISACRPRLLHEIESTQAATAVTLGNAAAKALLDTKTGITKLRGGDAKQSDYADIKVVPTFHPAFCLRDQGKFPLMLSDIGKIKPREASWIEPNIVVIEDAERALAAINGASTTHPYVLDVETGKEKEAQYSRTTNLLCVGLGSTKPDHNNRVVVIGRPAIHDRRVEDALIKLVSKTGVICQNGKFDTFILNTINHHDLPIYLEYDTMLASYSLNETPGTHGLKYLGIEILGAPEWEDEIKPYLKAPKFPPELRGPALEYVRDVLSAGPQLRSMVLSEAPENIDKGAIRAAAVELQVREYKAPDAEFRPHQIRWAIDPESSHPVATPEADGSYASIPPEILHKYNALDVQVTRLLHKHFIKEQAEDGLTEFNKHLMVMANALMKVERNGLAVDYDFNVKLYDDFTDKLNALRERLPDDINIGSPIQLKAHIEDAYGYSPESTAEETITGYINDPATSPAFLQFCKDLLEYRRWSKLRSTYVTSIKKQAMENNGKVLPTFKIDQATTGRLASKSPNVQNMPRQFDIKRQFIPSRVDRVFVHADYCLVPGTKLLKTNMDWENIENLQIGDELVGFKVDQLEMMTPTKVTGTKIVKRKCLRIKLLNGAEVICSENHQFPAAKSYKSGQAGSAWKEAKHLKVDDRLRYFIDPWERDNSAEGGYLAGFMDGEGSYSWKNTTSAYFNWGQNPGPTHDYVKQLLEAKGFVCNCSPSNSPSHNVCKHYMGGYKEMLRFIGMFRPVRFEPKQEYWTGRRKNKLIPIIKIDELGEMDVVALETDEHTFIANGILSHNSQLELRVITWLAQDEAMRDLFNDPTRDVFDELTLSVYGMASDEFAELKQRDPKLAKEMRVVVKSFAYGIAYGRTPQGIAQDPDLNLTVEEAVERHAIFKKQIPDILAFQNSVIKRIHSGQDLVNVFGRRRRFHLITNQNRHDLEKQAMAYLPQSTASDICVTALSRLPDTFDPRNIIHDALLLEAPRDEAHEIGAELARIMIDTAEEITGGYVKFDVDYDIGETWADV